MDHKRIREENLRIKNLMNLGEAASSIGGVKQLIYNPLGYGYTGGGKYRSGFRVSNHDNHLHIGFSNREVAMKVMDKSISLGLRTSENPYTFGKKNGDPTGKVERVHVTNSDHYREFPGSPTVGGGVDISGDPSKIKELVKWIESEFGGDTISPTTTTSSGEGTYSDEGSDEKFDTQDVNPSGGEGDTKQNIKNALLDPFLNVIFGDDKKENKGQTNESISLNEAFSYPSDSITKSVDLDKKTVNFPVIENRKVLAPNSGKIITVDKSECSGKVVIKTSYEGKNYFIHLCGVNPRVNVNDSVSKDEVIGVTNSRELKMEVLSDVSNKKIKILQFYSDNTTKKDNDSITSRDSSSAKPISVSELPGDLIVAPLSLAGKFISGVYNQIKAQNKKALNKESIREDIIKMKKLMD